MCLEYTAICKRDPIVLVYLQSVGLVSVFFVSTNKLVFAFPLMHDVDFNILSTITNIIELSNVLMYLDTT